MAILRQLSSLPHDQREFCVVGQRSAIRVELSGHRQSVCARLRSAASATSAASGHGHPHREQAREGKDVEQRSTASDPARHKYHPDQAGQRCQKREPVGP